MNTKMLKAAVLATVVMPSMAIVSSSVLAQDGAVTSDLDASIRLGVEFQTEPDADISVGNFGSRIRWSGSADMDTGGSVVGYLELGISAADGEVDYFGDVERGIDSTRQAWIGVSTDSATITIGKQYTALYDAVTEKVDIANWGSCAFELQCDRETSIIKYSSVPNNGVQLIGSLLLTLEERADSDLLNGFDIAAKLDNDGVRIGAGLSYLGEGDDRADNGFALSVSAASDVGAGSASAAFSYASDDYLGAADNSVFFTGTYSQGDIYGLLGIATGENDPFYITAGYVKPLIADRAFLYFELGIEDADIEGADTGLTARSVLVFNFGKNYSSGGA